MIAINIVEQSARIVAAPTRDEVITRLERFGRVCYRSQPKGDPLAFLEMLLDRDPPHLSVFEHCSISTHFVTDRGVSHEMVRHRIGSYSQESTRFCNYGAHRGGVTFCRPAWRTVGGNWYESWRMGMADAAGRYQAALEDGEAPQQARDFLPNSVKTEIVATWNLAQVLHVLKMRAVKPAHPQMIALMGLWISEIRAWFPEFLDISRHIWSPRGVNEGMERAD